MKQSGRVKVIAKDRKRGFLHLCHRIWTSYSGAHSKGNMDRSKKRITAKNSKEQEYVLKK